MSGDSYQRASHLHRKPRFESPREPWDRIDQPWLQMGDRISRDCSHENAAALFAAVGTLKPWLQPWKYMRHTEADEKESCMLSSNWSTHHAYSRHSWDHVISIYCQQLIVCQKSSAENDYIMYIFSFRIYIMSTDADLGQYIRNWKCR